jgi:hypothetical protein
MLRNVGTVSAQDARTRFACSAWALAMPLAALFWRR